MLPGLTGILSQKIASIETIMCSKTDEAMTNPNDPINHIPGALDMTTQDHDGLTKREYFAAMAMQGLLVNYVENQQYGNRLDYPMVEEIAVRCADALISELNKY